MFKVLAASEKSAFGFAISNENESDLSLLVKYSTIENGWWIFIMYSSSNKLKEVYDLVHEMVLSALGSQNLSQHVQWIADYIVGHHSWDHCNGHEYRMVDDKVLEKKVNCLAFADEERYALKDTIITTIEVGFLDWILEFLFDKKIRNYLLKKSLPSGGLRVHFQSSSQVQM